MKSLSCLILASVLASLTFFTPSLVATSLKEAEQAFSEMKVYSNEGRPWRVAQEDWNAAKLTVKTDPKWKSWLSNEKNAVDAWISKRSDRVSWICGWHHDFVSPKDAAYLTWTPEIPGEEVSYFHSPSDPHVEITPKLMAAWVYEFRIQHAEMMLRSARLYHLTGEKKYAEWSAKQLDFYAEHYLDWIPQRKDQGARLYWQSLDVATSGFLYINTVRLIEDEVNPVRKQFWWDHFFKPEADVLNEGFHQIHNIATWHRTCVAAFALVYHNEALWHTVIEGKFGLREQIARGITDDFLWYEQSFHYNEYVVEALNDLFEIAGLYNRSSELALEMVKGENLMLSPIYLRFPNGTVPNPADGTGIETAPHDTFLSSTYRVFPTTLGLETALKQYSWNTLIDPPHRSPRPYTLPEVKSVSLESSNMALIRKGPWQVFLHYGQLTASHSQAEALNYSVFYGKEDITHDPGTTGYGSPYYKEYYTQGLNHNIPLIDGKGEVPPKKGRLLKFSPDTGSMTALQPNYRPDAIAERTLFIQGNDLIDIAQIKSSDGSSHALGLAFHIEGKADITSQFKPTDTLKDNRPISFKYWKNVTRAECVDEVKILALFGETQMKLTFKVKGPFTIWHSTTPDVPPKLREGFYIETQGKEAKFITILTPVVPL